MDWQTKIESLLYVADKPDLIMSRGKGNYLWDSNGKKYLDFINGWAVNALGHSPKPLRRALNKQLSRLVNASPAFYNDIQLKYAHKLVSQCSLDRVFFCSSGAEANEGAIKLARKYGQKFKNGAYEIICLQNSFHGRSLATMSASGKEKFRSLFEPKVPGFRHIALNSIDQLHKALSDQTCAIMLEPIQGEAGVFELETIFAEEVKHLCRERGILLILDEIQTGLGRTGKLFAYEHYNFQPDIMTLGKGIGGGFPLAATLCSHNLNIFAAGDQGGTYTNQPLAMAAGYAVLKSILANKLWRNAEEMGQLLKEQLTLLAKQFPICHIRGRGLLLAFDLKSIDAALLAQKCLQNGLIVNAPQANTIRLIPALTVGRKHVLKMAKIMKKSLQQVIA